MEVRRLDPRVSSDTIARVQAGLEEFQTWSGLHQICLDQVDLVDEK